VRIRCGWLKLDVLITPAWNEASAYRAVINGTTPNELGLRLASVICHQANYGPTVGWLLVVVALALSDSFWRRSPRCRGKF